MVTESMLESAKEHISVTQRKEDKKMNDPRNVTPNGREKESQGRLTETRVKDVQ